MDDFWSLVPRWLDKSTRVSYRLTCKQFNKNLPRNRSTAEYYTYQCIKDGNSRLIFDWDQPLREEYYKAAIEANDIEMVKYLVDNCKDMPVGWEELCIWFDREEIYKILYKRFRSVVEYWPCSKSWIQKRGNLDDETIYMLCIKYNNYDGFVNLLRELDPPKHIVMSNIKVFKRYDMLKSYLSHYPSTTIPDEFPAIFDDTNLIPYVRNKDICVEMSIFYRNKSVYKKITGLDEFCLTKSPSDTLVSFAISHLDLDVLKMIYEKYPKSLSLHEVRIYTDTIRKPITATIETAEFLHSIGLLNTVICKLFNHIPVIQLAEFLESKGIDYKYYSNNIIRCMKTEEECREWVRMGNKFKDLGGLFCKKFIVKDELIKFLYDNRSGELSEVSPVFNPAVIRWLSNK